MRAIVAYVGQDSPTYAAALAGRLVAAVEPLRRYPRLRRVVPEYGDDTIRELIVGNYRVVYRLRARRVVVHGSRDVLRRVLPDVWDLAPIPVS